MRVLTCTSRFLRLSAFVMVPTSSRKKRSAFMTRTSLLTCRFQQGSDPADGGQNLDIASQ